MKDRIVDITVPPDQPVEDMKDPHEQVIACGYVNDKLCVSFMVDGKPVFSFNEDDTDAPRKVADWLRTQPEGACMGWVRLMQQARQFNLF